MKSNFCSLAQFCRLKGLPLSNFLPLFIFTVLLLTVCLAGTAAAQLTETRFVAASYKARDPESRQSLEHRVFDLVNNERIKNGRQPLAWIDQAAAAARSHSIDMARYDYLSHSDLAGKEVDDRANQFGLSNWRWIGENIAWLTGYDDPAPRVVASWMRSRGHRENILQKKFREAGIGMALAPGGKTYFTQVFVLRK